MKQHNSTYFRRFMNKVFNTCEESNEPVLITTRKDDRDQPQKMVIISEAQYLMMIEQINKGFIVTHGGITGDYTLTETPSTEFYNKQSDDFDSKINGDK